MASGSRGHWFLCVLRKLCVYRSGDRGKHLGFQLHQPLLPHGGTAISISQFDEFTSNARHGTKRAMIEPAYKVDTKYRQQVPPTFDGADDYNDPNWDQSCQLAGGAW